MRGLNGRLDELSRYHSGQKEASVLTICWLEPRGVELFLGYHGGWLTPDIYFLGHVGRVQVKGIGLQGCRGYIKQVIIDLCTTNASHTTNAPCEAYTILGNTMRNLKALFKLRPGFRASVDADTLGSSPLMTLCDVGHMHVMFEAEVKHARTDAQGTQKGERGKRNQKAGIGKEKDIQDNQRTTKFSSSAG
ncbi:uncharacterized protein LACBIDRAFT_312833 [Laccaria bicolor S238N-H82]|uniref:Predicted protein n=1 Tax=Laccaria bicolor (strain S238N-H82 / ATCC MYA-4686) TaxID=486041 RepID=B0DWW7_LACBS|nr:uncharacterized protein LACBIDRAFT_312833 [Laccaria bicolor S238N-H82]EDR00833.1 predicted protein [Laccaria bicolor S238N-H82]|eukprot:XP_001888427.1 predicted protein [Laccaria bicolor S238N-H82]